MKEEHLLLLSGIWKFINQVVLIDYIIIIQGGEHMVPHVLGVGYAYNEYEVTAGRWKEFEIEFDYAV